VWAKGMIDVWVADKAVQVEKSRPRSTAMDKTAKETSQTVRVFSPLQQLLTSRGQGKGKRKSVDTVQAQGVVDVHSPPEIDTKGWLS